MMDTSRSTGLRLVAAALLAGLALNTPCRGQTDYVRYHDGVAVPLTLDTGRIAVFIEGDLDGSEAVAALTPFGIPAATIQPMAMPGWSEAGTPPTFGPGLIEGLVAAIAAAGQVDFVTPVFLEPEDAIRLVTPTILVRFGSGVPPSLAQAILDPDGDGQEILEADWAGMTGAYLVDGLSVNGFDVMTTANAHAVNPQVLWSHVNWMHRGKFQQHLPNDPNFQNAWHLLNTGQSGLGTCLGAQVPDGVVGMDMQATLAWDYQFGDPAIIVGVFDNGINQAHPDINQVVPGVDLTQVGGDGGPTTPFDTHGTPVAGSISAFIDNAIGSTGIAPNCRTISMKFANTSQDSEGNNFWVFQEQSVAVGLFECFQRGVRVTNHSYGITPADAIEDAFDWTRDNGMVHFASAGNGGEDAIGDPALGFPASHGSVNGVAALDPDGNLAPWSNWGPTLFISAPGSTIQTTFGAGSYGTACGTSFSSPLAAGVAALILSCDPDLTAQQVEDIMAESAMDLGGFGYDPFYGWGFVDAHEAVRIACFEGSCIGGPGGSCFQEHSWPGCEDEECCKGVCTAEPACCDLLWDATCADLAWELCGGCETQATGECDEAHGTPGCLDGPCCNAVCDFDPLCCSVEFGWDVPCVQHAIKLCDLGPDNDDCSGAPEIFDGFTPFTIANAANDGPSQLAECNWDNTFTKDIWYEYHATCTGTLEVSACTQTPFPTWVGIYDGCGCPQDTVDLVECANAGPDCVGGEIVSAPVVAGACYKIRVAAGNPDNGDGLVHIACRVPGDDVGDGSPLPPDEGSYPFSTLGATTDGPPHPGCLPAGDDQIHQDLWYLWTAPSSDTLTLSTCGAADFDTRLAVYEGCTGAPGEANLLGCNDDGPACPGGTSSLDVAVVGGQCYLIRLGGAAGQSGTGTLTLSLGGDCPADLDGSGAVDTVDFLQLLAAWGPCTNCQEDLDGSGAVDTVDFLQLLAAWGPCP